MEQWVTDRPRVLLQSTDRLVQLLLFGQYTVGLIYRTHLEQQPLWVVLPQAALEKQYFQQLAAPAW